MFLWEVLGLAKKSRSWVPEKFLWSRLESLRNPVRRQHICEVYIEEGMRGGGWRTYFSKLLKSEDKEINPYKELLMIVMIIVTMLISLLLSEHWGLIVGYMWGKRCPVIKTQEKILVRKKVTIYLSIINNLSNKTKYLFNQLLTRNARLVHVDNTIYIRWHYMYTCGKNHILFNIYSTVR